MKTKPEVVSGLLGIFLHAVETTIRQRSPGAPAGSRFGAVAFVHRFGGYLNSHIHYHVLITDGVFSASEDGEAEFHPALDLDDEDFLAVQNKMRKRGLRWLHRHGHLDDVAVHTMDSADHAGGWSVDASVTIPSWDRHGLERLVRYCARPPLSQERLGKLNDETLVYSLRKPTVDGRAELVLTPLELLDRLSKLMHWTTTGLLMHSIICTGRFGNASIDEGAIYKLVSRKSAVPTGSFPADLSAPAGYTCMCLNCFSQIHIHAI